MANDLQFQPYQLPTGSNVPQAFNQDYFNTLQNTLGNEYQNQANNLGAFQNAHGLGIQGGNAQLLQNVLGSPQTTITGQIMPTALQASSTGATQQFQSQMQQAQFQQQLQYMQQQFIEQEQLLQLYQQLMPHGYKESFGQTLESGLASQLGSIGPKMFGQSLAPLSSMNGGSAAGGLAALL